MQNTTPERRAYLLAKRCGDILLAALGLVILAVPMLIIALAIYLDDPHGSPLYISQRCGQHGRLFRFYKFRTMVVGAEAMLGSLAHQNEMKGPAFKIQADPRLTRFGHALRRSSLDELPQLWNVLRGEMSLVGPRPPLPAEVAQYTDYQRQRLQIKPGLTCYWQVQPARNAMSFDDWMALDMQYIRTRCLRVDAALLLRTVVVVLRLQGQ